MNDEFVSNYEQDIKFVTGFAGSGKSTHLAANATDDSLTMVPTHKAAWVLKNKRVKHVYTIHSVLKLVPTVNQNFRKGQRMQKLKQIGSADLNEISHVIIDEFSMINVDILDLLLELLPSKTKVTVYGDPYQLPPVDGESVDPLMYTDDITELTTQHRANAPEVVETFMRFMNFIKNGAEMNLKMNPAVIHGSLKEFNPETDRILAYTNARVIALNNEVAKLRGLPIKIEIGEDIFLNDMLAEKIPPNFEHTLIFPGCMRKGKLMDRDDLLEAAEKLKRDINKFNSDLSQYEVGSVYIEDESYIIHYDVDHYANAKRLKEDVEKYQHLVASHHKLDKEVKIASWCKDHRDAKYVRERGQAWARYLAHQNLVFSMRRPFATTVHKAQGSEFSTVFIDQNDIKRSIKKGYYETYARLMYVALSRAIDKVVIL